MFSKKVLLGILRKDYFSNAFFFFLIKIFVVMFAGAALYTETSHKSYKSESSNSYKNVSLHYWS